MFSRAAIAILWFVSFACLHELLWSMFGSPRVLGIGVGLAAAAFYFFDLAGLFFTTPGRSLDPLNDRPTLRERSATR
jgi:hypothetical protein